MLYTVQIGFHASRPLSKVELAFILEHLKCAVQEAGEVIGESDAAAAVEVTTSR